MARLPRRHDGAGAWGISGAELAAARPLPAAGPGVACILNGGDGDGYPLSTLTVAAYLAREIQTARSGHHGLVQVGRAAALAQVRVRDELGLGLGLGFRLRVRIQIRVRVKVRVRVRVRVRVWVWVRVRD